MISPECPAPMTTVSIDRESLSFICLPVPAGASIAAMATAIQLRINGEPFERDGLGRYAREGLSPHSNMSPLMHRYITRPRSAPRRGLSSARGAPAARDLA
jgi:hypothetical protein